MTTPDIITMHCTLCSTLLTTKIDTEYYHCPSCAAYQKDKQLFLESEQEKRHYENHHNDVENIGYIAFTAPVTETVLSHCTPDMLGLDYGCGTGPVITKQLIEKGFSVNLYDPYFYPSESYLNYSYDFIFSCEVFEHFYDPLQEITKLYTLLKKGGLLIIKTHLFDGQTDFKTWYYRKDHTHVFIYTPATIQYIASHFGFEIISLTEKLVVLKKE